MNAPTVKQSVILVLRLGKWELRVEVPPTVAISTKPDVNNLSAGTITGIRSQGGKGWLKPSDGTRWKNASEQVVTLLGNSPISLTS